ncbi:MAG: hypothetical protein NTY02_18470 [Acidobacteria bacterium]|nr:hypothetical protein [Acidobacteriota bacterium]
MSRINWREVCKFASGAAFVGTIANAYLWAYDISGPFPFLNYTIPPWLFGVRAIVSVAVFALCVYVAYLRPAAGSSP